jgi:hypothetical protein
VTFDNETYELNLKNYDRVVAQAVSRRRPIAAAGFRVRVRSNEICGEQNNIGAGFL